MENKANYWQIVFVVTFIAVSQTFARLIAEVLPFNVNRILIAVFTGALCGLLGSLVYLMVKNAKNLVKAAVYVVSLAVLGTVLFGLSRMTSDSSIVTKDWKTISNGEMTFEYPYEFSSHYEDDNEIASYHLFNADREDRIAMNFIIDFKGEHPVPAESLEGAIYNSLIEINAYEIDYGAVEVTDNKIIEPVTYKINGKDRNGLGIIYFDSDHYELALFFSNTKIYPEEFFGRIIESVAIKN